MGNLFDRIPPTRLQGSTDAYDPKYLAHYVLGMQPASWTNPPRNAVEYTLRKVIQNHDPKEYMTYMTNLSIGEVRNFEAGRGTPYDISIAHEQTTVLIELDKAVNWEFAPDEFGMTTKADYQDDNFGLTHLYTVDGKTELELNKRVRATGGCRALFFRVYRRYKEETQQVNFHVTFTQPFVDDTGKPGTKHLLTIFDPDIKNDGGSFP